MRLLEELSITRWLETDGCRSCKRLILFRLKAYKAASPKLQSSRKSTTTRSVIDASTFTIVLSSPLQIHDQSPCSYNKETPSRANPSSSSTSSIALPAILAYITIPSTTRPANPLLFNPARSPNLSFQNPHRCTLNPSSSFHKGSLPSLPPIHCFQILSP